jgi:hypothetical protein
VATDMADALKNSVTYKSIILLTLEACGLYITSVFKIP